MNNLRLFALLALGAALCGCRTTKDILDDYDRDIASGAYAHAAIEVGEMAAKEDDSVVLWRLQTAGAHYLADEKDQAIRTFDRVEDAFADRDGASTASEVAQDGLTMMVNERTLPYVGTGEDRVFTCFYKAVDFASRGELDAARVEFNRASQHQENWLWARQKEIEEAREKLEKDAEKYAKEQKTTVDTSNAASAADKAIADAGFAAQVRDGVGFDPLRDGDLSLLSQKDYLNAYVQHAAGVFRWLNRDGGRDFMRYAMDVKPGHPLVTRDFEEIDETMPTDQVWVYIEDGLCPVREEWRIDLPLILIPYANRFVQYAGMALPKLKARSAACSSYEISAGAPKAAIPQLEDIDHLLKTEFDVYMSGCLKREITRTIVKVGVQVGFGVAAETTNTRDAKLAFRIAQLGAATWAMTTTAADLRTWTTLPKTVYATRVTRPADGKILIHGNGAPVAELTLPKGNSMVFVRKPSAQAPAVVKTVTFK